MRSRLIRKLRQAKTWARERLYPRAVILMYHRIGDPGVDPWSLCVSAENFEAQLRVLQQQAQPISLQALAAAHRQGSIPEGAVVITFDDGYANNLYQAKPILEQLGVPATVFVTSGYLGSAREYWWDDLEQMLLRPEALPDHLPADLAPRHRPWFLGDAAAAWRTTGDRAAFLEVPEVRARFYHQMWEYLAPMSESERNSLLEKMRHWSEASATPRESHRPMTPEEVCTLAAGGLVEIGAHTLTHPRLSVLSREQQRQEIEGSKQALEAILHHTVASFAYPFGNFVPETVPLVAEAGFTQACSTVDETVWGNSKALELPRFEVQNWSGPDFSRKLARWLS
ncbi:polysaccharide deacetylase family protein [Lyngbya confervoides]|uniref:Polysaccharide deacetylase family protein n=1 Tax=Lyngbya confervoides BDU141951 TaxID=1574623 RepID=A0ABD4T8T5_9CYAN|nr:polysaccharide deacetylase family protein [Lyngbya confervoides]MCM1984685.1 polysaccharide deacetylase family protein [Lyngbya confervoides BDU141951]